jgi:hypothetical protein
MTQRMVWGTLMVLAMAGAAAVSLDIMNDWIGDWGALLWVCGTFFLPFLAGIAWGHGGSSLSGRIAGAALAAFLVLGPGIGYAIMRDPDLAELQLPLLWAVFTPLAVAQGVLSLPVGARVRKHSG